MTVQEIVDFVFEIAPNPIWGSENIFEFGDGFREVTGVGVAWWITNDILEKFPDQSINLGLTHERLVYDLAPEYPWGKIPRTDELKVNQCVEKLTREHQISIHRFHSNIDLVDWGMPHAFLDQLGWGKYATDWSRGIPVVQIPPIQLKDLIGFIKTKLELPFVRYDGDLNHTIQRVAIPWGGLCQWWNGVACAAPLGFDAIIGGDIIDGVVRFARENNWAVIDAMHHTTEREAMKRLSEKLQKRFPKLHVEFYENSLPWAVL